MAILQAQGFHGRLEARVGDEGRPGRCGPCYETTGALEIERRMNFDGTYYEDIMEIDATSFSSWELVNIS